MIALVARRFAWSIVVVWFVVTATFVIAFAIPADPAKMRLGPRATPDAIAKVRKEFRLDEGLLTQYGAWLGRVAHADLGKSYRSDLPVATILADRIWPTTQLALAAIVLQLLIGVPLGVVAAIRRNRWPDRAADLTGLIAQSAPPFVIGTVLVYVVAYRWGVLPIGGYGEGFIDRLSHLVLPAMTLAAGGVAFYARVVRVELGDVLAEDYIRTARAKGLSEPRVVLRHGLRSALGALVTLVGIDLGVLLGGTVVTEQIFQWPGLGREVLQAVFEVDLPVILGVVLITSIAIAVANLLADLVQLWLDPRLRD